MIAAHQFIRQAQVDGVSETTVAFAPINLLSTFSLELTLSFRKSAYSVHLGLTGYSPNKHAIY